MIKKRKFNRSHKNTSKESVMVNERHIKKSSLLFISLFYFLFFVLGWIILDKLNYSYLLSFKLLSTLFIIIGVFWGTIKWIQHSEKEKRLKKTLYILYSIVEGTLALIFMAIVLSPILFQCENIVVIDHKIYIEVKYSFLLSNGIYYYDFLNPIFRKQQPRFEKQYDDSLNDFDYLGTIYYDDEGHIIDPSTNH